MNRLFYKTFPIPLMVLFSVFDVNADMQQVYQQVNPIVSMFFLDNHHGWVSTATDSDRAVILKSTDGGDHWEECYFSIEHSGVNPLILSNLSFVTPGIGFMRALDLDGYNQYFPNLLAALYMTNDGGESWSKMPALPDSVTAYSFCNEYNGWAAIAHSNKNWELMRTIDGGVSWTTVAFDDGIVSKLTGIYFSQVMDIKCVDEKVCMISYHVTDHMTDFSSLHISLTEDGGKSWKTKFSYGTIENPIPGPPRYGYFGAASTPDTIFLTGVSDEEVNAPLGKGYFVYDATQDSIYTYLSLPPVWGIEKRENGTTYFHFYHHPEYENHDCIFMSNDGGHTLEPYCVIPDLYDDLAGSGTDIVGCAVLGDGSFLVSTREGDIFKYRDDTATVTKNTAQSPSKIEIYPVSPNPFNLSTTIHINLMERSKMSLNVYDSTGRMVDTLIDNRMLNPGLYDVEFDGRGHSSGVYFYSCISGGFCQTGKMVFVK